MSKFFGDRNRTAARYPTQNNPGSCNVISGLGCVLLHEMALQLRCLLLVDEPFNAQAMCSFSRVKENVDLPAVFASKVVMRCLI